MSSVKNLKAGLRGLVTYLKLAKSAFELLVSNDPLRMAGATAFFTTFALPPILIFIIQLLGVLYDPENVNRQVFKDLSENLGEDSSQQVIDTLTAFKGMANNTAMTVAGAIFLLFVSTTLFTVIRNSLNQLWKIRVVIRQTFMQRLRPRLLSLFIILGAGVLFAIGIMAEGVQTFLGKYVNSILPQLDFLFNSFLNYLISVIIITAWLSLLFRILPDGRPAWKVALAGAFVTSLLFNIGKFVLRWALAHSNINNIYGASSSVVLLLLFVFYSSLILYYGAAFTKVLAVNMGRPIKPLNRAIQYEIAEKQPERTE